MTAPRRVTTEQDPRWQMVRQRDRAADGKFYYSVKTTGVYCRPSCATRLARPENVQFHDNCQDAERAGFRPCKRCKPNQPALAEQQAAKVEAACRLIECAEESPDLATIAAMAELSPFHFHRIFKSVTGVTPKAYAQAHRQRRVQDELRRGGSVTAALYDAGFNSNAPFYDGAGKALGMTPKQFQAGGRDVAIRFAVGECQLGSVLVACSDIGVCAILLGDDPEGLLRDLQDRFPRAMLVGGDIGFERIIAQVVALVDAPSGSFDLPLDVRGTAFQRRVWQKLRDIPAGSTASYSDIAELIGQPKAARAVAAACAANALAVAIPCHRVVRTDGTLSGYRWGIDRKRRLLDAEAGK